MTTVEVDLDSEDRRLDNFLISELHSVPRNHVYALIRTGQVRVNSRRAKARQRLKAGDRVRIPPVSIVEHSMPASVNPILKNATRNIIFEDADLIVIDKSAGVAVHAGTNHRIGLIEAMRMERPDLKFVELVHRLDKQTSGILLLAKNRQILRELHSMLRRDSQHSAPLTKSYVALLKGIWQGGARELKSREAGNDKKLRIKKMSKKMSMSTFRPVRRFSNCTLMDITLHTGKTHQARQHALQTGHPIAGDRTYGDRQFNTELRHLGLNRMFLHAYRVTFTHPVGGELITLESALPQELTAVLDNLNGAVGKNDYRKLQ